MTSRIQIERTADSPPTGGDPRALAADLDTRRLWAYDAAGVGVLLTGDRPYNIGAYWPGQWSGLDKILVFPAPVDIQFLANYQGSIGILGTAPTGNLNFDILYNGELAGTMSFTAGQTQAGFVDEGEPLLAETGGVISVAPAETSGTDATAADLSFVLVGTRP